MKSARNLDFRSDFAWPFAHVQFHARGSPRSPLSVALELMLPLPGQLGAFLIPRRFFWRGFLPGLGLVRRLKKPGGGLGFGDLFLGRDIV